MLQRVRVILSQGCSALLDRVFDLPDRRRHAERRARDLGLPFNGYWLHAQMDVRLARVHAGIGNVSDATTRVLMARGSGDLPVPGWIRLDATVGIDAIATQISSDLTQPPHATAD
jgi:predicted kinase